MSCKAPISKLVIRQVEEAMATWPITAKSIDDHLAMPICGEAMAEFAQERYGLKTLDHGSVQKLAVEIRDFVLQKHPSHVYTPFGRREAFIAAGLMLFGESILSGTDPAQCGVGNVRR